MKNIFCIGFLVTLVVVLTNCSGSSPSSSNPGGQNPDPRDTTESNLRLPEVVSSDISINSHGKKISQLIGDYDPQRKETTRNMTNTRYKMINADLGVPFQYNNRTYLLFGDTHGAAGGDLDAYAYTTDSNPDDGLSLQVVHDKNGIYDPVSIPGIDQAGFEVPMEGVEVDGKMYIYNTTGHTPAVTMDRSVVARSNTGGPEFEYLYDFSDDHFINLSLVKTSPSKWQFLPANKREEKGMIIFGSGAYRSSDVYLAYQPALDIENPDKIQYFAGINKDSEQPVWSSQEDDAARLFDQPCVGELSVSYNKYIDRWIMLYNCDNPVRIDMRTAKDPWGPWTEPQAIFRPWDDNGYCNFIHLSWANQRCDEVMDRGREYVNGGAYGPYQFENYATGDSTLKKQTTTIYFTMSTWNPYTVVLMKAKLQKK